MATAVPIEIPAGSVRLRKSATLLDGALGVDLDVGSDADLEILTALKDNVQLPLSKDPIRLGSVSVGVSAQERSVRFDAGAGSVAFTGGARIHKGIGIYTQPDELIADLGIDNPELTDIELPLAEAERLFAFYWGYDLEAAASGSVALGASAAATFGVDAARGGAFAVIRAYAKNPRVGTAVRSLIESWRLPRQIETTADLSPGTWIVAEVDGSIRGSLGVDFGYSQHWVRAVQAGGLAGDIGLKIQAAATATFGFEAAGRYAVVVGRESLDPADERLRVRVHKLAKKGWSFALDANLGVTPGTGEFLPREQLDDFIAGIFGIHGAQIAESLKEIRHWTDPTKPLSTLAGEFVVDFARDRLDDALDLDVEEQFRDAHARITAFLDQWDSLGSRATSALLAAARLEGEALSEFTERIRRLTERDGIAAELTRLFARVDFFSTPIGKWLQPLLAKGITSVLADRSELEKVRKAAATTLAILEGRVLDQLLDFVGNKVGLPALRAAVAQNDFDALDAHLKQKLVDFLDAPLDDDGVEAIRAAIHTLDAKGRELYLAGVQALNRTYHFSFHHTYQKTTARTALIDISLDFGQNPNLGPALAAALDGDFTALLGRPGQPRVPGMILHEAVLTHRLERQSHVEINLPFYRSAMDHRNWAEAKFALEEDDGRLFLYDVEAEDAIVKRDRWASTLSVSMDLAHGGVGSVRRHGDDGGGTVDYAFVQSVPAMRTEHLQRQIRPLAERYFPNQFAGSGGAQKPSVGEWAADLDKLFDRLPGEGNGTGTLGNTLLSFRASLPGEILTSWLDVPEDPDDIIYMELSRRTQQVLRDFIPYVFFQNVRRYGDLVPAAAILAYGALPISTSIEVDRVSGRVTALNTNEDVFWNWKDSSETGDRRSMLRHSATIEKLRSSMDGIVDILASTPGMKGDAVFYAPETLQINRIRATVLEGEGRVFLESLLFSEASLIRSAVAAGMKIAAFRAAAREPERAVAPLAEFGAGITETFNSRLQAFFGGDENPQLLRNLGLLALVEVSQALPNAPRVEPVAALDVSIFRSGTEFPPPGYPENPSIAPGALGVRQWILEDPTE